MSEVNPFAALGQQFTPEAAAPAQPQFAQAPAAPVQQAPQQFAQAPAAPVQQFAQAPVQQFAPAPQGYAPQGYAPQGYAPQAPVAPQVPLAAPIRPGADAPNPGAVGADAFGSSRPPSSGEKHAIRDDLGQPLLIRISAISQWADPKSGQVKDVADVDWVVLNPAAPLLRSSARIFNGPIVRDLKDTVNQGRKYHTGRVIEVPSKFANPALALGPLTDEENQFAVQAGKALGWWN